MQLILNGEHQDYFEAKQLIEQFEKRMNHEFVEKIKEMNPGFFRKILNYVCCKKRKVQSQFMYSEEFHVANEQKRK